MSYPPPTPPAVFSNFIRLPYSWVLGVSKAMFLYTGHGELPTSFFVICGSRIPRTILWKAVLTHGKAVVPLQDSCDPSGRLFLFEFAFVFCAYLVFRCVSSMANVKVRKCESPRLSFSSKVILCIRGHLRATWAYVWAFCFYRRHPWALDRDCI